jgi:signal transduction histidine kinase
VKRPAEGLLGLNKVFFFITLIFLATLTLLSFALWQTTKNNELSGNRQLVESVLKLANDSIVSRDQIGIERVLRASHQDGRYFRLVLPDNFEITWPREPFNPVWETKPSYKTSVRVGEGQALAIEYWAPAASGWTRWTFLALAMSFLLAAASIVALVLHVRRWRQDVNLIENYLSGAREKPALGTFRFEFFHRLAAQIFERESERERLFVSEKRSEGLRKLADLSAQVAHDIRSPLSALEVASGDIGQLPEDKRIMIRSAVNRIRDIANSLMARNRTMTTDPQQSGGGAEHVPEAASAQLLSSLIESIVSEKRLQFRSRTRVEIEAPLDAASYGLFARIQPAEFKRVISNLVNNSVEAFGEGRGSVQISLSVRNDRVAVKIEDDGKGIEPDVLAKLGRRGETHGKVGGSGLGLAHAKSSAASWGGNLDIRSEAGAGTTVVIDLPQARTPDWFVSELTLTPSQSVVILDDDLSIHQIWQGRLEAAGAHERGIEVVHLSKPADIKEWAAQRPETSRRALFLLDYELLGYRETGLSLAEDLGIGGQSILVTSRYEEPDILNDCMRLKTRMIPKGLAGLVPICISAERREASQPGVHIDAILIDDDPLARMTWKMSAERAGKILRPYTTVADFLADAGEIAKGTPIYVDAELADGLNGAEESRRFPDLGFQQIYLATGHDAARFASFTHLRAIVGKEPPWREKSTPAPRPASEEAA